MTEAMTESNRRKRAKPLLGTVVEISILATTEACFIAATDAAFKRIEDVHRAMSFHESGSDLCAIAHARAGHVLHISADTWHTLALALEIEFESGGVFNPSVAPVLVARGLLPSPLISAAAKHGVPRTNGLHHCISLEENNHLRIHQPVWIDLGGVAKGYAVDEAVTALIAHDVPCGVVNAGGDLRVFGDVEHAVGIRVPSAPQLVLPLASLKNLSCATTAAYYLDRKESHPDHVVGHVVGSRHHDAAKYESVSVFAPRCAVADALTKVLWLSDPHSAATLAIVNHYQANAALINSLGHLVRI